MYINYKYGSGSRKFTPIAVYYADSREVYEI